MTCRSYYPTVLSPVLLITTELALDDEKLEPLDLLPLDELEPELELVRIVRPVLWLPAEFENPGPLD